MDLEDAAFLQDHDAAVATKWAKLEQNEAASVRGADGADEANRRGHATLTWALVGACAVALVAAVVLSIYFYCWCVQKVGRVTRGAVCMEEGTLRRRRTRRDSPQGLVVDTTNHHPHHQQQASQREAELQRALRRMEDELIAERIVADRKARAAEEALGQADRMLSSAVTIQAGGMNAPRQEVQGRVRIPTAFGGVKKRHIRRG